MHPAPRQQRGGGCIAVRAVPYSSCIKYSIQDGVSALSVGDTVGLLAVEALVGLLMLAILWPTKGSARRLLKRWGVPDPTDRERDQALTYLKRRRFWYPWLYIALAALFDNSGVLPQDDNSPVALPGVLLLGALLAEVLAQRRSPSPHRVAVPVHRGLTDLVPRWALVLHACAAAGAVLLLGGALIGVGWASRWLAAWDTRALWIMLAAALVSVLTVWLVVALALRRPTVDELRIDPLLRARSARVAVGLGIGALGLMVSSGSGNSYSFRQMLILVASLAIWSMVAGPVRRPRPA
jgi:hypothetical protein